MKQTKYEKDLIKNIETFDKAYENYNNDKLDDEEREKASKIISKMTDDWIDGNASRIKLFSYKKGKEDALKEFLKIIDETFEYYYNKKEGLKDKFKKMLDELKSDNEGL
jgi:hypothetical protein